MIASCLLLLLGRGRQEVLPIYMIYASDESNGDFCQFKPTAVDLHYRDPIHYAEILAIQGKLESEKLKDEPQTCLRFSMQIDGSVDTKQHDKKFVFVRFSLNHHWKYIPDLLAQG